MRLSGPIGGGGIPLAGQPGLGSIIFYFNKVGGVDRYDWNSLDLTNVPVQINNDVYLFVREFETEDPTPAQALAGENNLWVSVGKQTGASNVAYIAPVTTPSGVLATDIATSQVIATTDNSAAQ